ncbi:MAG: FAD-dependent oxidoreductase [Bacteroidales bacterium]
MYKISEHPVLPIPEDNPIEFLFDGKKVIGQKGNTIAAALHRAGYIVHNHSLTGRNRTLQCGIGKCGACEMIVDGKVARICITKVDNVKCVERIQDSTANSLNQLRESAKLEEENKSENSHKRNTYKTTVAIIGAGPSGLAVREELNKAGIDNFLIDNNSSIGGQFNMQTHQFFFFEKEKRFGGKRGFEIAKGLAGEDKKGIFSDSVVWDILDNKRLAVKNINTSEVFYVVADQLVVATGAIPFMPPFKNDDVPGVYTAAVVQRMMNSELTLLGKNILTIGAGNIGYLTSYQAMQAGANIKAIVEAAPNEGGFPVQANRIKRLGIPIITSHLLLEAIPNKDYSGVTGAIIAKCENFKAIPGTEQIITGIDCINICTGLVSDNQLLKKGKEVFGRACYGVGDAVRIGEGTSAVLRGRQCAFQIMEELGTRYNYDEFLKISKEYIDSQQHPVKILNEPIAPTPARAAEKPFVVANCLYGFACNPCTFACKQGAITKISTSTVPTIDYTKCIGCMECVYQCPGLAIFGYNKAKEQVFLPVEYKVNEGAEVILVNDNGSKVGNGIVEKILVKPNKTNIARVKVLKTNGEITNIKGFILKENYPPKLNIESFTNKADNAETYVCHCEDITENVLIKLVGTRKSLTADELKHITRIGMGACRGKRCIARAKQVLRKHGIEVNGEFTPRGPMANLVNLGDIVNATENLRDTNSSNYEYSTKENLIISNNVKHSTGIEVDALIAGGGIGGSSLFRYMSEAGYNPILINYEAGSSWRNIAGGRPAFSLPALADLANHNLEIFKDLSKKAEIDFHLTNYVNFAHDEQTYKQLDASRAWSDAFMVERKDFQKEVSEFFNPNLDIYSHALISRNCWQASPGKTINAIRNIGISKGGTLLEGVELVGLEKNGKEYLVLLRITNLSQRPIKIAGKEINTEYVLVKTPLFINALGANAGKFALKLGIETNLFPVKHQAFITKRLPLMGKNGACIDMLIDRRKYKGFSAVYGQQLTDTGQIIGCASPVLEATRVEKNLKFSTQEFLEIVSEVFTEWFPCLKDVGFQATWCGYYTEPRYIIDPEAGLFVGMRGHGFMLSQYTAKLYVDSLQGKLVPDYFKEMGLKGNGLSETAFK